MTKEKILLILWFTLLFFGSNWLHLFNLSLNIYQSILIGLSLLIILPNINVIIRNKNILFLISFVSSYSIYKLLTDVGEGTRQVVLQILEPSIIYGAFLTAIQRNGNHRFWWHKMTEIFFLFFLVETGWAIFERIIGINILGFSDVEEFSLEDNGSASFRSASLHGHPLYNALMVSISMAFILFSPLKIKYKLTLWSLGYISILCFNTRGSIVGNVLLLGAYILYVLFVDKNVSSRIKKQLILFSSFAVIVGMFLFFNIGLGGRLAEMGLFDESSAQTRIDVWNIFDRYPIDYFLWGISHDKMQDVMIMSGLLVTENFWIDQVLRLGVVFLSIYIIMYYKLIKSITSDYSFIHKMFVTGAFLLIASTNNSLSSNGLALLCFLILLEIFNPKRIRYNINKKYLDY